MDAQTGQELLTLKGAGYHDGVAFSPNGHWLASDVGGKRPLAGQRRRRQGDYLDATPLPDESPAKGKAK